MHAHHEANAVRTLDGRYHATLTMHRAGRRECYRATEIAHELGYRITNAFATRSSVYLDFTADESPVAQARAAATSARLDAGLPVPTALPGRAGGPTSYDAARARFLTSGRTPAWRSVKRAVCVAASALAVAAGGFLITDHCPACRVAAAAATAIVVAAVWTTVALVHAFHLHRKRLEVIETYDRAAEETARARTTPLRSAPPTGPPAMPPRAAA
ncbi:hypothetical protein [Yinghuangia sp. YIM S09857]|uniref:hypothetical protein n=1 Tax=Yinghuangia sp. YIM S09857 TaxID=3436929 RepID=UPI003F53CC07